jgi:hypothetical protein
MARRGSAANEVRKSDVSVEIGGKILIERGPKLKIERASEELLDDAVTASHYKVGMRDAKGKVIEPDKEMTYLDWLGEHTWYVYALRNEPVLDASGNPMFDENGDPRTIDRWVEIETVDGEEDDALERARALFDSEG